MIQNSLYMSSDNFEPGAGNAGPGEKGVEKGDDDIVPSLLGDDAAFDALERTFRHADALSLFQRLVHQAARVG